MSHKKKKIKLRSFKSSEHINEKGDVSHTAVSTIKVSSVTLKIWQHGAKENYCNFSTFNRVIDTKTSII